MVTPSPEGATQHGNRLRHFFYSKANHGRLPTGQTAPSADRYVSYAVSTGNFVLLMGKDEKFSTSLRYSPATFLGRRSRV